MQNRREFMKTAGAAVGGAMLPLPALSQQGKKSVLRFVPESQLTTLDPFFTPVTSAQVHGWHVYDTLFGMDSNYVVKPQMAEGASVSDNGLTWTIRLRDGLRFHNGEPVRAADCAASMDRWSKRDGFGQQLAQSVEEWRSKDDKTIEVKLKRRFPRLLEALGRPSSNGPFVMPEHLAKTDAFTAITDPTGSGPLRFIASEFVAGSRVVYEKFPNYQPRSEAADFTSGGKLVHFDRIEWHIIPDVSTALSALINGEVDWIEFVENDMLPLLEGASDVTTQIKDPTGRTAYLRFNTLHAPFDKPGVRRAILESVNQVDFLAALSGGDPNLQRECYAMYPCGMPQVKELGKSFMRHGGKLEAQKAALKAAGYNGEKVVILSAADIQFIKTVAEITADLLRQLGMNVDLQTMDWATLAQRRASKEAPENGGWNIFPTAWPSPNVANPAINVLTRGVGAKGYVGWFENADVEQAVDRFISAEGEEAQQLAFDQMQELAFQQAPVAPLGVFRQKTAFRSNIKGVIPGCWSFPWNVRRS